MLTEQVLTNAQIVLKDQVIKGSIHLQNGRIVAIDEGNSQLPHAQDMEGNYLIPGMVELHTDNLEKFMTPRPKVNWPTLSAMLSHDGQVASAGITTVFDALSIGDISPKGDRMANLEPMMAALKQAQADGLTRVAHKIHLRCEVAHPETYDTFQRCMQHDQVGLVSLMDHSPGQRQFQHLEQYRIYYQGKYGLSPEQMAAFELNQLANAKTFSHKHRLAIAEQCRDHNVVMASHDDATFEHVDESHRLGMSIAEFPTSVEAAQHSTEKGLRVLMGAPNIVRGGSHSGNVAASSLAKAGFLDILSSDYYPNSLLHAAFLLTDDAIGFDLPQAIRTVSYNPAQAVQLTDRGELAAGKLADLVQVSLHGQQPIVKKVWKQGVRVI
ncbi:MAG: alpha-D-ribose 1-methylphosphonate 5-triphosphate diphosphatase [Neisseriaceae bacterium]|nr:alpha-D-ribose 1-methylphosphonate 5-triphosphate diphosphatase [Neisseriaceae bacterium]MBP6861925.1 alpha-D-ribose 1-methylphosphonate 5-triphosphate diphosphatase [Neisseriaceae bacterium]